jgi:hypothetical protein
VRRVARRWRSFAFASSDERPSLCPCRCFMGVSLTSRSRPAAQDWGGGGAWRAAPPAWPNPGTMPAHPQQRPHFPAQLRRGGWQRAEPSIAGPQTLPLRLSPRPPVRPPEAFIRRVWIALITAPPCVSTFLLQVMEPCFAARFFPLLAPRFPSPLSLSFAVLPGV